MAIKIRNCRVLGPSHHLPQARPLNRVGAICIIETKTILLYQPNNIISCLTEIGGIRFQVDLESVYLAVTWRTASEAVPICGWVMTLEF